MVYRCECDIHSNLLAKIFEHGIDEVLCIIDYYVPWDAIATDDVLPKEFLIEAKLMLVSFFASIHFVKYSTVTTAKV
jgi:hypothetical protein